MLDKIKYIPLSLFCIATIKALILGASWVDAPVLAILALTAGYYEFKSQDIKIELMHKRIDEVDKHLTALYKQDEEAKSFISAMKMKNQMRA